MSECPEAAGGGAGVGQKRGELVELVLEAAAVGTARQPIDVRSERELQGGAHLLDEARRAALAAFDRPQIRNARRLRTGEARAVLSLRID